MESLRNRLDVKLENNRKDYLKCASKPSYMLHKIFDNNLAAISRCKLAWKFNKLAYIGILHILKLNKALIYEFHYDYIENKYDCTSKLLFTDTDSLRCEIKTEDVYEDFSSDKEIFDFSNYWTKSKYCFNCNKFVIGKTKGIEIEEALRLLNLFDWNLKGINS